MSYYAGKTPELGQYAELTVLETHSAGLLMSGGKHGNILLPNNQVLDSFKVGDSIRVFVYLDSEDRVIATRQRPRAQVGQVANLQVVDVNATGAFLDWGLSKDLFLPYSEQKQPVTEGQHCLVYVRLDNTGRILATTHLSHHIEDTADPRDGEYKTGQKVDLMIVSRTDLGYKAVVDNKYWGLIHKDSIHQPLKAGQRRDGYIRRLREDERLDLSLEPIGHQKADDLSVRVLNELKQLGGFLDIGDKSPADIIEKRFGVSKRAYKMAIGKLYKERLIDIEAGGIRLKGE